MVGFFCLVGCFFGNSWQPARPSLHSLCLKPRTLIQRNFTQLRRGWVCSQASPGGAPGHVPAAPGCPQLPALGREVPVELHGRLARDAALPPSVQARYCTGLQPELLLLRNRAAEQCPWALQEAEQVGDVRAPLHACRLLL